MCTHHTTHRALAAGLVVREGLVAAAQLGEPRTHLALADGILELSYDCNYRMYESEINGPCARYKCFHEFS